MYDSILVIMDRFTKMARYLPVHEDITVGELADVVARKHVLPETGLPHTIISDRGLVFYARF